MKFDFIIIMSICCPTQILSTSILKAITNDAIKFPLVDELLQLSCENELNSLDFNIAMSNINEYFISSPTITCLDLMNNNIQNIERDAFNQLLNLTHLFLSNNGLNASKLFNFGGHHTLQVLVMNNAVISDNYNNYNSYNNYNKYNDYDDYDNYNNYNNHNNYNNKMVQVFGEYPNLEILSLRQNFLYDLHFSPKETRFSQSLIFHYNRTISTITQKIPFPKLRILDLSENNIQETNFLKLLSNSLYFLDLHNNQLKSFNFNIADKLFALNLDGNHFNYISNSFKAGLSLAGLTDLQYLSVSSNRIKNIESNAFQDNEKLVYLNLIANNISYLHPDTFANMQYLKTLDLSQNELVNVPQISNEIGISTLYLNRNNITKLMSHVFVQMPKLTKLLLGENQINEIDVNAFVNLTVLEKLDLSRNMLSSLPEGWTESLVSLKYLDLSKNKFTSLESLSLTNTLPLIEIYLMTNTLEYLNVRYFESLPQNLTIDLINKSSFAKWTPKDNY